MVLGEDSKTRLNTCGFSPGKHLRGNEEWAGRSQESHHTAQCKSDSDTEGRDGWAECPRLSCALGRFSKAVRESSSQSHLQRSPDPCLLQRGVPWHPCPWLARHSSKEVWPLLQVHSSWLPAQSAPCLQGAFSWPPHLPNPDIFHSGTHIRDLDSAPHLHCRSLVPQTHSLLTQDSMRTQAHDLSAQYDMSWLHYTAKVQKPCVSICTWMHTCVGMHAHMCRYACLFASCIYVSDYICMCGWAFICLCMSIYTVVPLALG